MISLKEIFLGVIICCVARNQLVKPHVLSKAGPHHSVNGYDYYHAYTSKQQVLDHSPEASDNLPGQVLNYL